MIKIQPSASRIIKSESLDRLTLTYPAQGFLSLGGFAVLFSVFCVVGLTLGVLVIPDKVVRIVAGSLLIPPVALGLVGAGTCVRRWRIDRTPAMVFFRRGGLWGTKSRQWPAEDVSSFWVDVRPPNQGGSSLIIGFRNGRSEELLVAADLTEDLQWVAAMMKDPIGERRPASTTARAAAEPVPRRSDSPVEPAAVSVRKWGGGVELSFLPLLDFKFRWWKLLATTCLGMSTILIVAQILVRFFPDAYPTWITRAAAAILLLIIVARLAILLQTTVIQVLEGVVTIVQNQHRGNFRFPVDQVEFVQTFGESSRPELQFLLRGKPKVRVLHDRPADELEWAARFLRVAIKGRAPEEAASLKMEASEGECQVCGEKMESRVVFCGKCRTPHHEECWSYVGQCSTFACREIRFTRT